MKTLLLICIFFFTVLFLNLLAYFFTGKKRKVLNRLHGIVQEPAENPISRNQPKKPRKKDRIFARRVLPASQVSKRFLSGLQTSLGRAGIPLKAEEYLLLQLFTGVLGLIFGLKIFNIKIFALILMFLGLFLPSFWVKLLKKRRVLLIEGQLL